MPTIPDYASKNSYDRVQQKQDTDSSYLIILNYMHNLSLFCQFLVYADFSPFAA